MKNHIVVAQYRENINWISKLDKINNLEPYDIFVYHKDKGISKDIEKFVDNKKVIYEELPNVGRETHTYMHHILKHYNNLPDKIFFTQAEPFDHIDKENDVATNEFFFSKLDDFFNGNEDFKGYGKKHYIWRTGIGNKTPTMERLYSNLFLGNLEDHYFNNGGIFGVKKELILNRSKTFYEYCLKSLEYDKNPVEGFCYERLWSIIFNKNYKSKI